MQFIGHAYEGRPETHEDFKEQTPGPVGLHEFGLRAPSPVQYMSVYAQQHPASSLFTSIMLDVKQKEDTRLLTSMQPIALDPSSLALLSPEELQDLFDYLPPPGINPREHLPVARTDQEWWAHYCATTAGGTANPSGLGSLDETAAASDESNMDNVLLDSLARVCCKENVKHKKTLKRMSTAPDTKKMSKKPCQNAKEAHLTKEHIEDLYCDLLRCKLTALEYGEILIDHATINEVSHSCIQNIVTCKSRSKDSCDFWPDELWRLYREEVRCEECRAQHYSVKALCPHHNKGRPWKSRQSDAPPLPESKLTPMLDKSGKPKKLVREYKIHLTLAQVWEALGCKKTKIVGTKVASEPGPAPEP